MTKSVERQTGISLRGRWQQYAQAIILSDTQHHNTVVVVTYLRGMYNAR